MDALLADLQNVSAQLLPILGAVALIFLCILLKKAWQFIEKLNETVGKMDGTIKLADQSMEKIQAPLDTAVKLSHTVDQVHDKSVDAVTKATEFVSENMDHLKDYVSERINEKQDEKKFYHTEAAEENSAGKENQHE
jgi:uncharacterized protein YoxC